MCCDREIELVCNGVDIWVIVAPNDTTIGAIGRGPLHHVLVKDALSQIQVFLLLGNVVCVDPSERPPAIVVKAMITPGNGIRRVEIAGVEWLRVVFGRNFVSVGKDSRHLRHDARILKSKVSDRRHGRWHRSTIHKYPTIPR